MGERIFVLGFSNISHVSVFFSPNTVGSWNNLVLVIYIHIQHVSYDQVIPLVLYTKDLLCALSFIHLIQSNQGNVSLASLINRPL